VVLGRPPERAVDWDDEQREVIDALRLLPRRQREAIVLHHLVGLSVEEVGTELHAPAGTVKSWLSRGRASVARTLTAAEEIPT
jgi:RNA polymerase sigma-70 factor (ECF subfamily)